MSRLFTVALVVALGSASIPASARADDWGEGGGGTNGDVSVDLEAATPGLTPELFQSTLSPYGDWFSSSRYGEVWRPRVAVGWRPYYYGSWLWTDEGWYWDSSEPFAWAVYHYGRWVFDQQWGWVWVPGYQWAPAWVTWRYGVDAVGWAPLAPGVSVFVESYPFVDFWWTFVPCNQFVGVQVQTVAYRPRDTSRWFHSTRPAPPRTAAPARGAAPVPARGVAPAPAWGGPARGFIEQRAGRPVTAVGRPAPPRFDDRGPAMGSGAPRGDRHEGWGGRPAAGWSSPPAPGRNGGRDFGPAQRGASPRPEYRSAPRGDEGRSQGGRGAEAGGRGGRNRH